MPTLYVTGTSVGNGADLTEDVLQTYTLPANTLTNVGDILHIVAGGVFGGTSDSKTARIRFGGIAGAVLCGPTGVSAGATRWVIESWIVKTAAGAQSFTSLGNTVNANTSGTTSGTTALDETTNLQIVATGQNTTNPAAGSITCQYFHVRLIR